MPPNDFFQDFENLTLNCERDTSSISQDSYVAESKKRVLQTAEPRKSYIDPLEEC